MLFRKRILATNNYQVFSIHFACESTTAWPLIGFAWGCHCAENVRQNAKLMNVMKRLLSLGAVDLGYKQLTHADASA